MHQQFISFIVEYVSYVPDDSGEPIPELDDRTRKSESFPSEGSALNYISDIKRLQGKWLAHISLKKSIVEEEFCEEFRCPNKRK